MFLSQPPHRRGEELFRGDRGSGEALGCTLGPASLARDRPSAAAEADLLKRPVSTPVAVVTARGCDRLCVVHARARGPTSASRGGRRDPARGRVEVVCTLLRAVVPPPRLRASPRPFDASDARGRAHGRQGVAGFSLGAGGDVI